MGARARDLPRWDPRGDATFETEAPEWEAWDLAHPGLRVVAEEDGAVAGWATVSPASARECYRDVGVRERLGELGGRWRDVVFLERRSTLVV